MNNDYRFSVLMPVYFKENADILDLAIKSIVIDQLLLPDELIIVEDGPLSDQLYVVLDKYESMFPKLVKRVKLLENVGMGKAMNAGLMQSSFEWIARMDSDDIAHADRFLVQFNFLKEHSDINVLGSAIQEFSITPGDIKQKRQLPEFHDGIVAYMKTRNPINHMTSVYRREMAIRSGGYWDNRVYEDYNLWYEMWKNGCRFHNLQQILMDVRIGNNMVGKRRGADYLKQEIIFFKKLKRDKFIGSLNYLYNITTRTFLRMIPQKMLEWTYAKFLRV